MNNIQNVLQWEKKYKLFTYLSMYLKLFLYNIQVFD